MKISYIFSVGKPSFSSDEIDQIHAAGYKAGLFLDSAITTKYADRYDKIISIDFSQLTNELPKLESLRGSVDGLLCTYENYLTAKSTLATYFGVPGMTYDAAMRATDKRLMREAFASYDHTLSPSFSRLSSVADALNFTQQFGYPVIIKPTNLVKSLLVMRANSENELRDAIEYAQAEIVSLYEKYRIYNHEPELIIEEFIEGTMYSIAGFVDDKGTLVVAPGITALTTANDIGRDDTFLFERLLPAKIPSKLESELFSVATAGVSALRLTSTPVHIELISGRNGVKIVEIGARIGGYRSRMYTSSYGINLSLAGIQTSIGKTPKFEYKHKRYTAVYELFPSMSGAFQSIKGASQSFIDACDYFAVKAVIGQMVGPAKQGYKACVVVIVSSDLEDEIKKMREKIQAITVEVDV